MKIGLVSDTHGNTARLRAALAQLCAQGAQAVVHCGDIGSLECLRLLGSCGLAAYAVAGNMDRHLPHLAQVAASGGVTFSPRTVEVPLGDGRYLIATHGDDYHLVEELASGGQFPYICLGHAHRRGDTRIGQVRIINPGALHRADPPSFAILDTDTDTLTFLELVS
jgi:uncharacterized protein